VARERSFPVDDFIPMVIVFSIPIVAIIGGITSGIVKTMGQQRLMELAQRERMMAIERGVPLEKLPPIPLTTGLADGGLTFEQAQLRRSQGLMIGGMISAAIGLGMIVLLQLVPDAREANVWAVGLVPLFVGLACIISAVIVYPRKKS
jgi:hypothetical protein